MWGINDESGGSGDERIRSSYDYYFVIQFGHSFFFSHLSRAAVLIHDAAPTEVIPFCGDKIGEYMGHLAHDRIA